MNALTIITDRAKELFGKKPTQSEVLNFSRKEVAAQACTLLHMTEDQYAHFIYVSGVDYIKRYYATADRMGYAAERSKIFWNWWKMQWHARDQSFVTTEGIGTIPISMRKNIYIALHDVDVLLKEIYPGQAVTADIFEQLGIKKFNQKRA